MFFQKANVRRNVAKAIGVLEALEERVVPAISFQFDYSLDTNGFFDTQQKKDLLSYAGLMVAAQLNDTLSAITPSGKNTWTASVTNPSTGQSKSFTNPSLPAGVIRVYAGGRNINELGIGGGGGYSSSGSAAWNTLIKGRGNSGATSSPPTDVAPRISSIAFDSSGTSWHFGKTTSGLSSSESDFVSVAMHELGHVLGIGNSTNLSSFTRLLSGGRFTGAKARAENNGVNPLASNGHLGEGVESDGIEAAMDPTLTAGTRKFMSELDFAVLDDIGWDRNSSNDSIFRARHQLTHRSSSGGLSISDSVLFNATIESSKDVDLYRVFADAGTSLEVITRRTTGKTALNSYIRLFDAAGVELASANQGSTGGTDTLKFNVGRSDYYFIGVSSFNNRTYSPTTTASGPGGTTGAYTMAITMSDLPTRLTVAAPVSNPTASSGSSLASASNVLVAGNPVVVESNNTAANTLSLPIATVQNLNQVVDVNTEPAPQRTVSSIAKVAKHRKTVIDAPSNAALSGLDALFAATVWQ